MNKSKKNYKTKVVRKYVEFYPTERDLIEFIEAQQAQGIPFAATVKGFIRYYLYLTKQGRGANNDK